MKRELFFKICSVLLSFVMVFCLAPTKASADSSSDKGNGTYSNPVIYADVPDVCTIRVGSTYYMASTTMHMSPGVPIMKSTDLVNWEIVNYVYDRIGENDAANRTGQFVSNRLPCSEVPRFSSYYSSHSAIVWRYMLPYRAALYTVAWLPVVCCASS